MHSRYVWSLICFHFFAIFVPISCRWFAEMVKTWWLTTRGWMSPFSERWIDSPIFANIWCCLRWFFSSRRSPWVKSNWPSCTMVRPRWIIRRRLRRVDSAPSFLLYSIFTLRYLHRYSFYYCRGATILTRCVSGSALARTWNWRMITWHSWKMMFIGCCWSLLNTVYSFTSFIIIIEEKSFFFGKRLEYSQWWRFVSCPIGTWIIWSSSQRWTTFKLALRVTGCDYFSCLVSSLSWSPWP